MRFGVTVLAAVAAFALTAGAFAAHASKAPDGLALRSSDFPAGAQRMGGKMIEAGTLAQLFGGAQGHAWGTSFRFARGQKLEMVFNLVIVAESPAQARKTFVAVKKEALAVGASTSISLPAYGDEQLSIVTGDVRNEEAAGRLVVRKNTVVWQLDILTDPTAKDFGLSKAQAIAELTKYAGKLKPRVGNG